MQSTQLTILVAIGKVDGMSEIEGDAHLQSADDENDFPGESLTIYNQLTLSDWLANRKRTAHSITPTQFILK